MAVARTLRLFLAWSSVALLNAPLLAAECPGGSPSAQECIRQLAVAEKQLQVVYSAREKLLAERYGESGYGGAEGREYLDQSIRSFRAANKAWREWRDNECWYIALQDGMSLSPDYASPVAEACKVERTQERIRLFKNERSGT